MNERAVSDPGRRGAESSTQAVGAAGDSPPRAVADRHARRVIDALTRLRRTRPLASTPAAGDPASLRRAYLDLLKLAICDLIGPTTLTVLPTPDGGVLSRELRGELKQIRAIGMDWPYNGISMGGLMRLDDLDRCIETIAKERVPGDLIEAGVWRGGAALFMRAALAAHGIDGDRVVVVADSFKGFKRDQGEPSAGRSAGLEGMLREIEYLAVPAAEVRENFARFGYTEGFEFVEGFFEETLRQLKGSRRWALIRLDGDTYTATRTGLEALYDDVVEGGFVIIDDYGWVEECRAAVDEFRAERGIEDRIEWVDWTCVRWRKGSGPGREPQRPPEPPLEEAVEQLGELGGVVNPRYGLELAPTPRIPTARESELALRVANAEEWLRAAGDRTQDLEAEVARLRERVGELEQRCQSYENALSWRITRPLRSAARLARRLAR